MSASIFLIFFIWLFAGCINGITAFGGNLVGVPILSLIISPREAILTGAITGGAMALCMTLIHWRSIQWKESIYLGISLLLGMPLGVRLLKYSSSRTLLLLSGVSVIIFVVWQVWGMRVHANIRRQPLWICWLIGIITGVMFSAVAMAGQFMVIYAILRKWNKLSTMANMATASLVGLAIMYPDMYANGLLTEDIFWKGLLASGAVATGIIIATPIVKLVNEELFKKLLLGMLSISCILMFMRAFSS